MSAMTIAVAANVVTLAPIPLLKFGVVTCTPSCHHTTLRVRSNDSLWSCQWAPRFSTFSAYYGWQPPLSRLSATNFTATNGFQPQALVGLAIVLALLILFANKIK